MRKLRFVLAVAIATLGINACTGSPIAPDDGDDCNPDVEDCIIKPVSGS